MAAVYKSLSRSSDGPQERKDGPKNRQKVLMLSSRGVTSRHRHLIQDLYALLPHSRKEAKFDNKQKLHELNELADLYNCNNVCFFEARKGKDLYLWLSKAPNGPTVKMHLQNLHTMEELHFTGNCLKGSRPILSFDKTFDSAPHLQLLKELLSHTFGVPKGARKSKPFVDHVMGFTVADGKIWIRCYQFNESELGKENEPATNGDAQGDVMVVDNAHKTGKPGETQLSLVEIGPRFILTPIVIQEGSFGGPIIYENKEFVSPNQVRRELRVSKSAKYSRRTDSKMDSKLRHGDLGLLSNEGRKRARDELDETVLFA